MDLAFSDKDEAFRREVVDFLVDAWPEENKGMASNRTGYTRENYIQWHKKLYAKGWVAPAWPVEYGGTDWSASQKYIFEEEMAKAETFRPLSFNISMVGPVIYSFGNEEQKKRFLEPTLSCDIWWCQGYSEPGSGSDLASLQTRAVSDGDEYVINGQKVWTSGADKADWIFCLVRTDPNAPKHNGITFILFDMAQAGVTVKPIKLISGLSPFCETFFEDARALKKNVVGRVNEGWTVAKRLLQYERTMIGGGDGGSTRPKIADIAKSYLGESKGKLADIALRQEITQHAMDDRAFGLTVRRTLEESKSTKAPSFVSSMFKLYGTEQNMKRSELLLKAMGSQMLGWEGAGFDAEELDSTRAWLRTKANSIEGGTSEVQLNIIAKRVLSLPD